MADWQILPALIPSRSIRHLRALPVAFALLLPLVTFIVIGRTVEVKKAADEAGETIVTAAAAAAATLQHAAESAPEGVTAHIRRGLRGLSPKTAGSGLTTLTMFFTPHLQTLQIHGSLKRVKRQQFAVPILAAGVLILVLALPFALVPYYLLPPAPTAFDQLPRDDGWTNFARVLMCLLVLASISSWLVRGRDSVLVALDVDGGDRYRAGKFVGAGIWVVVVAFAALGGVVADKIELLGVIATLAIGWFLPCKCPRSLQLQRYQSPKLTTSPLLHHHVPRPIPAGDHLPEPRAAAARPLRARGRTPAHAKPHESGRRRAPRSQRETAAEAPPGPTTVAGSDRVRGHSARWHCHAVLERGQLDWVVVRSDQGEWGDRRGSEESGARSGGGGEGKI